MPFDFYNHEFLALIRFPTDYTKFENRVLFPGKLFWLDRGAIGVPAKIGSVDMSGTNPKIIVRENLKKPDFLAIDLQKEILYFSSSDEPKV